MWDTLILWAKVVPQYTKQRTYRNLTESIRLENVRLFSCDICALYCPNVNTIYSNGWYSYTCTLAGACTDNMSMTMNYLVQGYIYKAECVHMHPCL